MSLQEVKRSWLKAVDEEIRMEVYVESSSTRWKGGREGGERVSFVVWS